MTTLKSNLLKKGKKGFTLTELAIVIAVIAILIAVLVPTFTSVINSARRTSAAETAKNALTEYTVETYSSVPDASYVIYEGYCWKVENGSFEVSDDITPDDTVYTTGTVQYTWGKDADAGITEVELYVSYTSSTISSTAAKVIAQNAVTNYSTDSGNTERVITYIGVPYGTTTTTASVNGKATAAVKLTAGETKTVTDYYYYTVSDGTVTSSVTTTQPTADFTDEKTYTGIIIGYSSDDEIEAIAAAAAEKADSSSAGDYTYASVTVSSTSKTYYCTLTGTTSGDDDNKTVSYSATITDDTSASSSYEINGTADSETKSGYSVQLYKTKTA